MAKYETTKLEHEQGDYKTSYKTTPPKGGTAVQKSLGEKLFKVVTKLGKQKKDYPGHLKHPLPEHYDTSENLTKKKKKADGKARLDKHGIELHQREQLAHSKKAMRAKMIAHKGMFMDDDEDGMVY